MTSVCGQHRLPINNTGDKLFWKPSHSSRIQMKEKGQHCRNQHDYIIAFLKISAVLPHLRPTLRAPLALPVNLAWASSATSLPALTKKRLHEYLSVIPKPYIFIFTVGGGGDIHSLCYQKRAWRNSYNHRRCPWCNGYCRKKWTRVQILDETDCISHSTDTLGNGMNESNYSPSSYR